MITLSKLDIISSLWYNDCMTKKELLAYTAGIIDGEGYLGLIPNSKAKNSFAPKVKVASTDIRLVEFLKDSFGGHLDKMRVHSQPNHKNSAMWTLSNKRNVVPFLVSLMPYLKIKDRQAKVIINYCKSCSYKEMRQKNKAVAIEKRIRFYKQIRLLNFRGLTAATTE